jgi:hypothetical protein
MDLLKFLLEYFKGILDSIFFHRGLFLYRISQLNPT